MWWVALPAFLSRPGPDAGGAVLGGGAAPGAGAPQPARPAPPLLVAGRAGLPPRRPAPPFSPPPIGFGVIGRGPALFSVLW